MARENHLCGLTHAEVEAIQSWISDHDYSFESGHFELIFSFSPYGNTIDFFHITDENKFHLEVKDWNSSDYQHGEVGEITIQTTLLALELSDEALEKYFQLSRDNTEAHINEDCEPPGSEICFHVYRGRYEVTTMSHTIEQSK